MNNRRVERMLRELHAGPPLRFLEDIFALKEIVEHQVAALRKARKEEQATRTGAIPALAPNTAD